MKTKAVIALEAAIQAYTALYNAGYGAEVNSRGGDTATVKTTCGEIEITIVAMPSDDVNAEIRFDGKTTTVPACLCFIQEEVERIDEILLNQPRDPSEIMKARRVAP